MFFFFNYRSLRRGSDLLFSRMSILTSRLCTFLGCCPMDPLVHKFQRPFFAIPFFLFAFKPKRSMLDASVVPDMPMHVICVTCSCDKPLMDTAFGLFGYHSVTLLRSQVSHTRPLTLLSHVSRLQVFARETPLYTSLTSVASKPDSNRPLLAYTHYQPCDLGSWEGTPRLPFTLITCSLLPFFAFVDLL